MWNKPQKTQEPENVEKAYEYAVFLLSLHLRTAGEVLKKMQQRGYAETVIEKVVEMLKEQKYLDDQRYAEIFLENLKTYRLLGYYGIKKKMLGKALPPALVESTLQAGLSVADERKIAERLLKREGLEVKKASEEDEVQYRTYEENSQNKQKQKLASRLKSRGFRSEIISRLLL